MKKNNTNLISVFAIKECVFWGRTWAMNKKFNWIGKITIFPPSLLIIGIFHYAFALMHFLFECFLWITMREQFKVNLTRMKLQSI